MSLSQSQYVIQLPSTPSATWAVDPRTVAQQWLTTLDAVLIHGDFAQLSQLFHEDCWWRDMLALDWDLRTLHTRRAVETYLRDHQPRAQLAGLRLQHEGKFQPRLESPVDGLTWVSSMFFFESRAGRGTGVLRLTQDEATGVWRAYSVYTALQELKEAEEPLGPKRWEGTIESMPGGTSRGNWLERRKRQVEFVDEEPAVVVIGAGQAGLNMGARLQSLGVSCLIVDRNERIGDNWRNRYRTLVTHDPCEFTHMAYLPFPKNWPQFTPKDKLADWFEAYASIMELNVWLSTSVTTADYDDASATWTVTVTRGDGSTRTLRPRHLVWCTGHSGEPLIPRFAGQESFAGRIYHGSQHDDASQSAVQGQKVVVVGTGNSGHDIAQNFHENGASVTMLQRRGTYVITADKGVFMMHEGLHDEYGPPTEEADIIAESLPLPVQFALNVHFTRRVATAEKEVLDGLRAAGFELDFGVDGAGISRAYMTRGGGYYIDVGCSPLIVDGKIKVKRSPEGIAGFDEKHLLLKDGSKLEADVVVLATGYDNMRTTVRKVLGDRVADRCRDVWDLDEEGEVNAMWRPSGHPGFWFMGGNLALCRIYSKFLALQIKAVEAGLAPKQA